MEYRTIPGLEWKPSALGIGAMRLPVIDGDQSSVDIPEATKMIRYAIDQGVNYLDTAYFYHGGNSETAVGHALQDGYRDKIKLATKFPYWQVKSKDDFDAAFDLQLRRLQTDHIDFYLLHGLHKFTFDHMVEMGIFPWLEKQVANGRLTHLGFSFHDDYEAFEPIVDAYDNWTFCLIQLNYMDTEYQAGLKGMRYASEKGLGVFVMEPLRGGQLAMKPPEKVEKVWRSSTVTRNPVDWALRWVWQHPEVSMVLSGMSSMEQTRENIAIAKQAGNSRMSPKELDLIALARQAYLDTCPVPCTGCRYCMPCPNNVEIATIFRIYSELTMYGDTRMAKIRYNGGPWGVKPEQDASNCVECGDCLEHCPQQIDIPEWLRKAHADLSADQR